MKSFKQITLMLHRDLGFFFAGIVIVYALSGIFMNHRDSIHPSYTVEVTEFALNPEFPSNPDDISDADIRRLALRSGQAANLVKHYYSKGNLKLLFKGGSNITVDLENRVATYENIQRRFIISDMVRLHYNPGSWWTWFSDVFAVSLILITLTGIIIVKGRKGLIGRGGLLMLAGVAVPILFLLF